MNVVKKNTYFQRVSFLDAKIRTIKKKESKLSASRLAIDNFISCFAPKIPLC